MRDFYAIFGICFLFIGIIAYMVFTYGDDFDDESITMALNETVRATALANLDNSSRVKEGEVFLIQDKFEADFKVKIVENTGNLLSDSPRYTFDYLKNANGSLKALKVKIYIRDKVFQSTYRVDIVN